MDTNLTESEVNGLTKLLVATDAHISYDLMGTPDEVHFTLAQLMKYTDIITMLVINNYDAMVKDEEDDVQ
jgi:hypothetical protein